MDLGDFGQIPGPTSIHTSTSRSKFSSVLTIIRRRVLRRAGAAFLCKRRLAGGAGAAALA